LPEVDHAVTPFSDPGLPPILLATTNNMRPDPVEKFVNLIVYSESIAIYSPDD